MGIKLQGRTFFTNIHNSVSVIVDELTYNDGLKRSAIYRCLVGGHPNVSYARNQGTIAFNKGLNHLSGVPVFTFTDTRSELTGPWVTGSSALLESLWRYIEDEGGQIGMRPMFVPFSNGAQPDADALRFVTTERQFLETFGITTEQVSARYPC